MSMQRQVWQDRAKGVGIILVVFGHVLRGLTVAGLAPDNAWTRAIDYTFYTFHMPLFFLLAGLNAERSLQRGTASFLRDKLQTIVWPYFLWSFIQGFVQIKTAGLTNGAFTSDVFLNMLHEPFSQFWFLYGLLVCHIGFAALGRSRGLLLAGATLAVCASPFAPYFPGKYLFNFAFYVGGVVLSQRLTAWGAAPDRRDGAMLAGALALFGLSTTLVYMAGYDYGAPAAIPAAASGIAATLIACKMMDGAAIGRMFARVGAMSMTIYILHIMAGAGARIAMVRLGVPANPFVYLGAATFVGIVGPMIAHKIFERLGLLALLGLAPSRKPRREARLTGQGASAPAA